MQRTTRLPLTFLIGLIFIIAILPRINAQESSGDLSLGDVARSLRSKKVPPAKVVIDNDNFSEVVDEAEKKNASGSTMVFSLDPGKKDFQVSSPDVSCSFSFSAKTSSLLSDSLQDDLPPSELAKLDGPATLEGDSLQVSLHNGTLWELREVVIGLTILRHPDDQLALHGQARIVPAVANDSSHSAQDLSQKQPDVTVLLKVKGSAPPSSTVLYRTQLNFALFPDQEWHWAIVKAKGIPPQASGTVPIGQAPNDQLPASTPSAGKDSQ